MSLVHAVTGEHSLFRRWTLYLFARYVEMPLLYWSYQLLCGRYRHVGQKRPVRAVLGWTLAAPFGYLAHAGRPTPADRVLEMIDQLEGSLAVGPCRCRTGHHACHHPVHTDIVIRTGVAAWTRAFPHEYRAIGKEEAKRIVVDCRRLSMWPMVLVHCPVNRENEYVICNCCTCGCVPYMLNRQLGQRVYRLLRGSSVSSTDPARCTGQGVCVPACPFGARALVEGKAAVASTCYGCGVCATVCPEHAIEMCLRA